MKHKHPHDLCPTLRAAPDWPFPVCVACVHAGQWDCSFKLCQQHASERRQVHAAGIKRSCSKGKLASIRLQQSVARLSRPLVQAFVGLIWPPVRLIVKQSC